MSSPSLDNEEPSSTNLEEEIAADKNINSNIPHQRPPSKRALSSAVIEISDTESDDSDICAISSYQASAAEVKKIRKAEYSSSSTSSSSSDYSSDSESTWEDDSIVIPDKKEPRLLNAKLNLRANRMDEPKINPALKSQELLDNIKSYWIEEKDFSCKEVTLTNEPFRLCLLHNVLDNSEIINNIVDDMNTLDWSRKKMDLYEFHQTTDLANLTWQRSIRGIYDLFKTEVMNLVSQVTGMDLKSVSASCSLYGPGDHLLVHDDRLGDRRVAFILYLAPWTPCLRPLRSLQNGANHKHKGDEEDGSEIKDVEAAEAGWRAHMGGALELLGASGSEVKHSVLPANNMLAFFPVGQESFHQVAEVLTMELPRLSINGWFHGPGPEPEPHVADVPPTIRLHNEVVLMNQWVESTYMSPRSRGQVQAQMESASEVCLQNFLLPERYEDLVRQLQSTEVVWEMCGPAQQRHYERLASDTGGPAGELLTLLTSSSFVRLLTDCTGLPLTHHQPVELQRWRARCFGLLPSSEAYARPRLEAVLYAAVPDHPFAGGCTTYVAPEDAAEGALVTLPPVSNALNLVYCDSGAASFTKYLSRLTMAEDECFYIVTCTYSE